MGISPNFITITLISFGFFLNSVSFNSTQNILTYVLLKNGNDTLGFHSIGILYLGWGIASLFSAGAVKFIGFKHCMVIGGVFNSFWIFGALLPIYANENPLDNGFYTDDGFIYIFFMTISFMSGAFTGPMWVSILEEVSYYSPKAKQGVYFSYFWSYYIGSIIIGNLLGFIIFQNGFISLFFILMGCLSIGSSIYFMLLKVKDKAFEDEDSYQSLQEQSKNTQKHDFRKDFAKLKEVAFSPDLFSYIPIMLWTGISIAFYTGILSSILIDSMPQLPLSYHFQVSMYYFLVLGLGQMIGTYLIGFSIDKIGLDSSFLFTKAIFILIIATLVLFFNIEGIQFLTYSLFFLWGVQDSAIATHAYQLLAHKFNSAPEAFSQYNLYQAISVFLFQILQTFILEWGQEQLYSQLLAIGGLLCLATTSFLHQKRNKLKVKDLTSVKPLI